MDDDTGHENKKIKLDNDPLFKEIDEDVPVTVVESMCMNCHENGTTRIMLTKVPHFKEIIVMAFECPHCNFKNNEVQSGEAVKERGQEWSVQVVDKFDLERQIVRNGSALLKIPQLQLELPPSNRSKLTTIEGLLNDISEDLSTNQESRKAQAIESYNAINNILDKIQLYLSSSESFTLILDDPAGNSYIESLTPPTLDPKLSSRYYRRTTEMDVALGLQNSASAVSTDDAQAQINTNNQSLDLDEVVIFNSSCSSCNAPTDTRMKQVEIPHFKNVILMSTTCDICGYKSNEIKSGGAISERGTKISLTLTTPEDLSRDILKSETCGLNIPEIDLQLTYGTLGGRFTTIEGLLRQVYDELNRDTPFTGDSSTESRRSKFASFLAKLEATFTAQNFPVTLILDDPVSNSYVQNLYAPDDDPNMKIEVYERTFDQNEDLGLNDINVDNYS
ncbi:Zinc finger protein zpr1 [Smittium culicis]|uniref:Zinc finger protein zpr1 n=3 Tax=Smittium culicis TaxID=133412 RepID=A0A1R1XLM3_9FUNG|nr:Zinc finger protein zpr1 [Smittium culicis]